jgi:TetR/AcrR family transcriptional regulator, lmrAB and yxaGH operons repressor
MARSSDARTKALATAERLFRIQGYAATGLTQIIDESGSPKGSFYFHFPGGKDALAAEVIDGYGARGRTLIEHLAEQTKGDASLFIRRLCMAFADEMRRSGFTLGCVVQNVGGEKAPLHPELTARLSQALGGWIDAIAVHLEACGYAAVEAAQHASVVIAALEGARTLARVQRDDTIFHAIAAVLTATTPAP